MSGRDEKGLLGSAQPPPPSGTSFRHSEQFRASMDEADSNRLTNGNSMRPTEMKLMAMEPGEGYRPERRKDYKGRIRTWPGILLAVVVIGAATALITWGAMDAYDKQLASRGIFQKEERARRQIRDSKRNKGDQDDHIEDDGQIGNPKKYPDMGCELPNYLSKNGKIYARSKNGTEVPVGIKGVNWFGMETGVRIPFGLWENDENGTSAYEVASFLQRHKFNSVRLPISIETVLNDKGPDQSLINLNTNRAINITTYMSTLQTVIEALAFRHITVMISVHTLTTRKTGGAWYDEGLGVSEKDFLTAIDKLTKNLCSPRYWNVLGLDLKNEPHDCTWGGAEPDWRKGAQLIGNRMLEGCPNWLAFVEGVNDAHMINLNGRRDIYFDWWGGGLQKALDLPIELDIEDKIVWAPHYYNTGVDPAWYLYDGGKKMGDRSLKDYVELDDETLKYNIKATMQDMFGFVNKEKKYAMVMGEFAGLYATDVHPKKTTKRTTDFTIEVMVEEEYAGAYMWSLNPESAYQFNPADTYGHFTEGLLLDDWLSPDVEFLEGMAPMDKFKDLKPFPCFPQEKAKK